VAELDQSRSWLQSGLWCYLRHPLTGAINTPLRGELGQVQATRPIPSVDWLFHKLLIMLLKSSSTRSRMVNFAIAGVGRAD
jgi:hypothetical protein